MTGTPQEIPSRTLLEAARGQQFMIGDSVGQSLPLTLTDVTTGTAMNEEYECYSAFFTLPEGTGIGPGSYQLQHPGGQQWLLMANPVASGKDGLPRIEILFHIRKNLHAA
jgi:hypothetical protein